MKSSYWVESDILDTNTYSNEHDQDENVEGVPNTWAASIVSGCPLLLPDFDNTMFNCIASNSTPCFTFDRFGTEDSPNASNSDESNEMDHFSVFSAETIIETNTTRN